MKIKLRILYIPLISILLYPYAYADEQVQDRVVSERLIAEVDVDSMEDGRVSPDSRHMAYVAKTDDK